MKLKFLFVAVLAAASALTGRAAATENVTNLIARMDPLTANVLSNFVMLTDIPRPTYHEKAVSDALVAWATVRGFAATQDAKNNVWFDVPATAGLEKKPIVILQGHMDMVAAGFDDPLSEPVVLDCDDAGTLFSKNSKTSIGADDGIGVAMAMTVADGMVPHGPVRVLLTTDEEQTQTGVQAVPAAVLQNAVHLINIDSENDGELTISSAANDNVTVTGTVSSASATLPAAYGITIRSFCGGHSGKDINKGRLNAIIELGRILTNAVARGIHFELAEYNGGDANNAIPPHAEAFVRMDESASAALEELLADAQTHFRARGETNAVVNLMATNGFGTVFSATSRTNLLTYLTTVHNGVWGMSQTIPGLVETSINLGVIEAATDGVRIKCAARGSVDARLQEEESSVTATAEACGYLFTVVRSCAPWPADPKNPLIAVFSNVWRTVTGGDMKVVATHAGLECGWFASKVPALNVVSVGPTIRNPHTVNETAYASYVSNGIRLLAGVLSALPPPKPDPVIPPALTNGAVIVLSTNDSHGHIDDGNVSFSQIAALRDELVSAGKQVLLLDAGDYMQGTTAAVYDQGKSLVNIVKATGYDLVTLGNHEFDYTAPYMVETLTNAALPVACCDLFETNGATHQVTRPFPDSKVFERGGLKIGVVGVDTPTSIASSLPKNFLDPTGSYYQYDFDGRNQVELFYARVQQAVDELKKTCDAVLVVGHLGTELECKPFRSEDLVANTTNITAVIDGHSHVSMPGATNYNAIGQAVRVTQTGGHLSALGWMTLDEQGRVLASGHLTSLGATNATVYALETNLINKVQRKFGVVVADAPHDYKSYGPPPEHQRVVRGQETNLGDLSADSVYWYVNFSNQTASCDLALIHGGGIRADVKPGEVTLKHLNDVMPFANQTVVIKTTGQTILDGLEYGAQSTGRGQGADGLFGGFIQTAGLCYDIATNLPNTCLTSGGSWLAGPTNGVYRVRNVRVYDRNSSSWQPLELDREYKVAGQSSLLQQACDGAYMWTNSTVVANGLEIDYMTFAAYCSKFKPGPDGRPLLAATNSPLYGLAGYPLEYETPYGESRIVRYAELPSVPFPAENVGVCSWSWATNMTTILEQMDTMGVKCMQLSLVPWVKPLYGIEYDASLRETFGKGESGDVFLAISNKIARGEISVLSTMISFPFDRWGSYQAISNSNGIVCNIATNANASGEAVSEDDPLGLAAWTVNSNLVDQAAAMTAQLGVPYITTEVGYLDKVMMDHGTNANADCNIGMERLYQTHLLCAKYGVKLLFESGQYSGAGTMALVDAYTNRYAKAAFDNAYGITVNDIGVNYDTANHVIYENDSSTNAFVVMKSRIPQVHVKDTFESREDRVKAGSFAVDVKWGTADVSQKLDTLAFLKAAGFQGNLLVEHEWGDDRVGDINAALKAILLANNDDPDDPWITPAAMTGETAGEKCEAALKAQGFSKTVAGRLADVQLYGDFRGWAAGNEQDPDELVTKSGVILASAYDAPAVVDPTDVTMTVTNLTVDVVSDDGAMAFEIIVEAEGYDPKKINVNLLKASLGVEGTTDLKAKDFSPDTLDLEFGTVTEGRLPVLVVPKKVGEATPGKFFIRTTAE